MAGVRAKPGEVNGNWTLIEKSTTGDRWLALCGGCGTEHLVFLYHVRSGASHQCGSCARRTHPLNRTRTYKSWDSMKQRCLNPKNTRWDSYGGAGVTVCDDWLSFAGFVADMGERPEGTSIDRIDPFGNYEPENCRWATPKQQQNNQRQHKCA